MVGDREHLERAFRDWDRAVTRASLRVTILAAVAGAALSGILLALHVHPMVATTAPIVLGDIVAMVFVRRIFSRRAKL